MEHEMYMESYKTLLKGGQAEYVEKKSRFIAVLSPARTEEEALSFIESVRKKHYDARHNCFAYIIGRKGELTRGSDDGEPGGTAGRPMLEVLQGAELRDIAAVVTRYFGGTLLGTGGLVRAYTQTVQEALKNSQVVTMRPGIRYRITADYNMAGRIQYILAQKEITVEKAIYTQEVELRVLVPLDREDILCGEIREISGAKAGMEKMDFTYYIDKAETV